MDRNGTQTFGFVHPGKVRTGEPAVERGPGQIWITTEKSALILSAGLDGQLSQLHFGSGSAKPVAPKKLLDFYPAGGDGFIFEPALRITHADGNTSTACASTARRSRSSTRTLLSPDSSSRTPSTPSP